MSALNPNSVLVPSFDQFEREGATTSRPATPTASSSSHLLSYREQVAYKVLFVFSLSVMIAGVVMHIVDYNEMRDGLGNLPMGAMMSDYMNAAMAITFVGLAGSFYSTLQLIPRPDTKRNVLVTFTPKYMDLLSSVPWSWAHTCVCVVIIISIVIDVMKPATIGFIMPGMLEEYGLSKQQGAALPTVAISGTTLGSVIWGYLGDKIGRRACILLSVMMFLSTSICGAMPSFQLNLLMCFIMGLSVGGLIPVCVALLSEVIPMRYRSKALITVLTLGSAGGYLAASGIASRIPAWRVLWFIGFPSGIFLVPLTLLMPESFRFLVITGREVDALRSMRYFTGRDIPAAELSDYIICTQLVAPAPAASSSTPLLLSAVTAAAKAKTAAFSKLFADRAARNASIALCGLAFAWGFAYYGFVNYAPLLLGSTGLPKLEVKHHLFECSCWSLLLIPPFIGMYGWWNSRWATASLALMEFVLFVIFACKSDVFLAKGPTGLAHFKVWYSLTLGVVNSLLAMIIVYASESFPTHLRSSGSGLVAAFTKAAGIIAPYIFASILQGPADGLWRLAVAVVAPVGVGGVLFAIFGITVNSRDSDDLRRRASKSESEKEEGAPGAVNDEEKAQHHKMSAIVVAVDTKL